MNNHCNKFLAIILFATFTASVFSQGYEIKFKINGLKDTTVIFGHWLNQSMYPDDTVFVNKNGEGVFKGKTALPGGMYIVYLPSTRYFEILLDKDQHFYFESDTSDFINTVKFKGSDDNQVFSDFQKYMKTLKERADDLQEKIKNATGDKERETFRSQLKNLGDERIAHIKKIINDNPGLWVSSFLKATIDIDVPEAPLLADGKKDSVWQYYYYRNHYFDNFNVSDARLLRTPLYEDKIMTFINKVIPQMPDSIIPYVDLLIEKSRADSNLFRYMLITLFNHFATSNIMGMDAIYIHIADKYYLTQAWWSDKKFLDDLKDRVEKAKPLMLGKVAPDIQLMNVPADHFIAAETDTALKRYPHAGTQFNLHDVNSKYIVLVFWEADCGHCKTAIPKLHDIYEKSLKSRGDVKIVAVSTLFGEDGKIKWVDFVNKNKLYDWINAWNPYSYQFKIEYDISSTPQIFILDKDKKIVAKRIGPENVEGLIKMLDKINDSK